MKKAAILTSGHSPFDERLFYKFTKTLVKNNFSTAIFASTENIDEIKNEVQLKGFTSENLNKHEKINKFQNLLNEYNPDIIICAELLPIIAAHKFKKTKNKNCKIIYDVTEWFPEIYSEKLSGIKKHIVWLGLYIYQYFVIKKVDGIIFGEIRKGRRFQKLGKDKPQKIISYYPPKKYFNYSKPQYDGKNITFCFSGLLTIERGINKFISVSAKAAKLNPKLNFRLKLIGKFLNENLKVKIISEIKELENIKIEFIDWLNYYEISEQLKDVDICFDLRDKNFVFNNSLPIKLFDYMACGKPIIYSNIDAITDLFNSNEFGFFVDPNDEEQIYKCIKSYLDNKNLLLSHSEKGRKLFEEFYNWELIENDLIKFITEI